MKTRIIFVVIAVFYCVLLGWLLYSSPAASADDTRVYVSPDIPNSEDIRYYLEARMFDNDGITITITEEGVQVTTNGWPTQTWTDQRFERVKNVASSPRDQAATMIRDIHRWQQQNEPPPPPPPPAPPAEPTDYSGVIKWGIIGGSAGLVVGVALLLVRARRRRQRAHLEILERAERQYRESIGE